LLVAGLADQRTDLLVLALRAAALLVAGLAD
jgi:hypothetical protein